MEGAVSRAWEQLHPDVLGVIFEELSMEEKFNVIPLVCKPWGKAVKEEPSCWKDIDISDWSYGKEPEKVDKMLRLLITRSSGSPQKLCVSNVQLESSFHFIAEHAQSLLALKLPKSKMNDSLMKTIAGKFSNLTELDLSYCNKIGAATLEAIGKNCKSLETFRRNLHPPHVTGKLLHNEEAHAIAATMPKLKSLEIVFNLLDSNGVLEIIGGCCDLELLDIRGCRGVELGVNYLREKFPRVHVLGPEVEDFYDEDIWEYYRSDTDSDTWDDDFENLNELILEDFQRRVTISFNDGGNDHHQEIVNGWPIDP
ncbi:OLC1v1017358C1 [Oldenlandia corymbosa var. corymbosa]|uniref:OLC1v1017358C1 n=1 Tax=Oldenlandia corymbosa var. corymbosa TaxID=529605 RepID=A0AAV1E9G2_OLDCO|nr:OLC1v1017358C1 [Oldenlandia corymbosa var. corymbosa]